MKFRAMVATDKVDANGERFSRKALGQIMDTAVGKPLTVEFLHKLEGSFVEQAELDDNGQLFATGELGWVDLSGLMAKRDLYLVPGLRINATTDDGSDSIGFKVIEMGLTTKPADPYLTPIEIYQDKKLSD